MTDSTATAKLIDGKIVAAHVREQLGPRIAALRAKGITPGLCAVLIGDNPASHTYVTSKAKACTEMGMYSRVITRPSTISQDELRGIVEELNRDPLIHGILVQSPLPAPLDEHDITLRINPAKDVDGFHPFNVGLLLMGHGKLLPCTPHGIIKLLEYYQIPTAGREVVVVGRSNIVGKPIAALLVQKGQTANATVTIAHTGTKNLAEVCRRAEILIVAAGRPNTVTGDMVRDGAVVIDVGVNRVEDPAAKKGYRLVGDCEFASCAARAAYITPVPGGVGPMTISMLLSNTVTAAEAVS